VSNRDRDVTHTFDLVLTRDAETLFWETVTLDPETTREVPSSWTQTGSFVLFVRMDEQMSGALRAPDGVTISGECWQFAPEATQEGSLRVALSEVGCSSANREADPTTGTANR